MAATGLGPNTPGSLGPVQAADYNLRPGVKLTKEVVTKPSKWKQLARPTTGIRGLCELVLEARARGMFPDPGLDLGAPPKPVPGVASAAPVVPKFENQWRANHSGAPRRTHLDSWINGRSLKGQLANKEHTRKLWAGPPTKIGGAVGLEASVAKVPEEGTGLWDRANKTPDVQRALVVNLVMVKALQDDPQGDGSQADHWFSGRSLDVSAKRAELDEMSIIDLYQSRVNSF